LSILTHLKMSTLLSLGILGLTLAATQPARAQQVAPTPLPPPAPAVAVATAARPAAPAVAARPVQARPVAPAGDPYGFTNWLNATRASYGLPPVGYDPNQTNWAAANNGQQQALGMGHHVMGPARRQNSAMGNYASIGAMWMNSPAHRAALLDPSIRWIGIAGLGAYWTFNAY
jgi:uncharacterized protein YkwD